MLSSLPNASTLIATPVVPCGGSSRDRLNGPAQPLRHISRDLACQITGAHPLEGGTPITDFSGRRFGL